MGPALGQDHRVATLAELSHGPAEIDRSTLPYLDHVARVRQTVFQLAPARGAGDDGRSPDDRRMRYRDVAGPRQQDQPGSRLATKVGAKVGEDRAQVGIDVLGCPHVSGCRTQRSGAEQDRVGKRTEQAHQETVGRVAAADHRTRRRFRTQAHDAVDRRHEVRVDDAVREAEAAVDALELWPHLVTGHVVLEEDVERFDQCSMRGLTD